MREMKEATEEDEKELDNIGIAFSKVVLKAERDLKPRPCNNRLGNFLVELDISL